MKAYCVYENELTMISDYNTGTTVFFSISGSFLTFWASMWLDVYIEGYDNLSISTRLGIRIASYALFACSVLSAAWAERCRRKKNSMLQQIKLQSEGLRRADG